MTASIHPSVPAMWQQFVQANPEYAGREIPESWHFCATKDAANECSELVLNNIKTATCSLLREYIIEGEDLPKAGQLDIVTNWAGEAQAIIRIIKVEQVQFKRVDEVFAAKEGEGDRTLKYWRKVHMDFFSKLLEEHEEEFTEDMMLVCEEFEVLWN